MSENCDDYDGYKKDKNMGFYYKCGEVVWTSEIEMRENLKCYDNAHSKARCITDKYQKEVEADLIKYVESARKPLCNVMETLVSDCLKRGGSLFDCNGEILDFLESMDQTVKQIYKEECDKNNSY